MKVSIIAGAYNLEHCFSFKKSLESIQQQSFRDFEFIICDDGSSDRTWEILVQFARTDSRVKLIRNQKNIGLAASLNKCLEIAAGEYIARHDCDDYSAPERIQKQLAYLEQHKDISVLGCQAFLFDENGVWGKEHFPPSVRNSDFLFSSPYKHGAVMFRRDVLKKAGGYRVAKETLRAEDYDLFMTLQTFCKGENLEDFLYFFCENQAARKRRKYKYRFDEAKVRFVGFKKLKLLPKGIPYIIKPLIVGIIPAPLLEFLKERRYHRNID